MSDHQVCLAFPFLLLTLLTFLVSLLAQKRLTSLPAELIHEIFDHLHESTPSLTSPLSKSLLPFQQHHLFKRVHITSYEQLRQGCVMAENQLNPLVHIENLTISIKSVLKEGTLQETEDRLIPTSDQVQLFYRRLVNTKLLYIYGSSRLASLLLTSHVAASSLPSLACLSLRSSFIGFHDPFHPSHYAVLSSYDNLSFFSLDVDRDSSTIQPYPKPIAELNRFTTKISRLSLCGPLSSSVTSVKALISSIDYLTLLSLEDDSETSRLYSLLDDFQNCADILYLDLVRTGGGGEPPQGEIVDTLHRCPNVIDLRVGGRCNLLSPSFYTALRKLPLKRIEFSCEADVSLSELTALVTGPGKLKTLESIEFNNAEGKKGPRIEDEGPYVGEDLDGDVWGIHPEWELPVWTPTFNRASLTMFIVAAEREGIEVGGSAVEALAVEDGYDDELEMLDIWNNMEL
ncbi:hypothetical protein JCM5353_008435 [Sporobolomyces roseus]